MFIMISGDLALVIDPVRDAEAFDMLSKAGAEDITIILTHEHFDHISGVNAFRDFASKCSVIASGECAEMIPYPDKNMSKFFEAMFINRSEEDRVKAADIFDHKYGCKADITFNSEYEFSWKDLRIRLHKTPGHSPGSVCAEIYNLTDTLIALATGDSLVQGNKVVTRLPGGDKKAYREITMPYLEGFGGDALVLPGHGDISYMRDLELG